MWAGTHAIPVDVLFSVATADGGPVHVSGLWLHQGVSHSFSVPLPAPRPPLPVPPSDATPCSGVTPALLLLGASLDAPSAAAVDAAVRVVTHALHRVAAVHVWELRPADSVDSVADLSSDCFVLPLRENLEADTAAAAAACVRMPGAWASAMQALVPNTRVVGTPPAAANTTSAVAIVAHAATPSVSRAAFDAAVLAVQLRVRATVATGAGGAVWLASPDTTETPGMGQFLFGPAWQERCGPPMPGASAAHGTVHATSASDNTVRVAELLPLCASDAASPGGATDCVNVPVIRRFHSVLLPLSATGASTLLSAVDFHQVWARVRSVGGAVLCRVVCRGDSLWTPSPPLPPGQSMRSKVSLVQSNNVKVKAHLHATVAAMEAGAPNVNALDRFLVDSTVGTTLSYLALYTPKNVGWMHTRLPLAAILNAYVLPEAAWRETVPLCSRVVDAGAVMAAIIDNWFTVGHAFSLTDGGTCHADDHQCRIARMTLNVTQLPLEFTLMVRRTSEAADGAVLWDGNHRAVALAAHLVRLGVLPVRAANATQTTAADATAVPMVPLPAAAVPPSRMCSMAGLDADAVWAARDGSRPVDADAVLHCYVDVMIGVSGRADSDTVENELWCPEPGTNADAGPPLSHKRREPATQQRSWAAPSRE